MRIPGAEQAVVDIRKLHDYALNSEHRVGRHKARLFSSLVGLKRENAEDLRNILLQVVKTHDATVGYKDEYGQRYQLDFMLRWHGREALVRSAWIIYPDKEIPHLLTCYPLEEVSE
jgi:hypothetical protein